MSPSHHNLTTLNSISPHTTTVAQHTQSHHTEQLHPTILNNSISPHSTTPSHHTTVAQHTQQLHHTTLNNSISPHTTTAAQHTQQLHLTTLNSISPHMTTAAQHTQQLHLTTLNNSISPHSTIPSHHTQQGQGLPTLNRNNSLSSTANKGNFQPSAGTALYPTRTTFHIHGQCLSTLNTDNFPHPTRMKKQQLHTQHNFPHSTRTMTVHSTQLSTPNKNEDCTLNTTLHTQQEQ